MLGDCQCPMQVPGTGGTQQWLWNGRKIIQVAFLYHSVHSVSFSHHPEADQFICLYQEWISLQNHLPMVFSMLPLENMKASQIYSVIQLSRGCPIPSQLPPVLISDTGSCLSEPRFSSLYLLPCLTFPTHQQSLSLPTPGSLESQLFLL